MPRGGFRGGGVFVQVGEDLLDDRRVFSVTAPCVALPPASVQSDAGNDPHCPAAMAARFDVDLDDPFQALRPGHGRMSRGGCAVCFLARAPVALAPVSPARAWLFGAKTP